MSLLLWSLVAFLAGIAIYLVGPLLVAPALPDRVQRAVAHWYWRQSAAVGERLQIVERDHGSHTLLSTSYRPEWGDEGVLDDETCHWRDHGNHMGRLFGRPIGYVSERFDVIMHPRHCEIGRERERQAERDELEHLVETESGGAITAQETRAQLPAEPRAVSAHDVRGILGDSAGPRLGETAFEYARKSQSGFTSRNIIEAMTFILAYGAAFGMMWFMADQSDTISRNVPLILGVVV